MFKPEVLSLIGAYIRQQYQETKKFPTVKQIAQEFKMKPRELEMQYGQTGFLIWAADPILYKKFIKSHPVLLKQRNITRERFKKIKVNFPNIQFLTPILCQNQKMELKCRVCNTTTYRNFACIVIGATKNLCAYCTENPKTGRGTTENLIRKYFEDYFQVPFPKVRHPKLVNPKTGQKLELDGYNESLNLAFEYRGSPHYSKSYFHKDEESFKKLASRNELKEELSKNIGLNLIIIPNLNWFLENINFPEWLKMEFIRLNIECLKPLPDLDFQVSAYFGIKRSLLKEEAMKIYQESQKENLTPVEFYNRLIKALSS